MKPSRPGSFHLFRVAGIDVFLHITWIFVALYIITERKHLYSSMLWNAAEYLALFGIVLLHEFGHALACRQVGGRANLIELWPLGGVAYVAPPPRPGPQLWSIAAGPLVNVALFPILAFIVSSSRASGWGDSNLGQLLETISVINLVLLVFNLLPIYPLDGGQILRSLLWFPIGPIRSLQVAVIIGFVGAAALAAYAFLTRSIWMGVITIFVLMNLRTGWSQAQEMSRRKAELGLDR